MTADDYIRMFGAAVALAFAVFVVGWAWNEIRLRRAWRKRKW